MMFQSKVIPKWEKLIGVVLLSAGFLFQNPLFFYCRNDFLYYKTEKITATNIKIIPCYQGVLFF